MTPATISQLVTGKSRVTIYYHLYWEGGDKEIATEEEAWSSYSATAEICDDVTLHEIIEDSEGNVISDKVIASAFPILECTAREG